MISNKDTAAVLSQSPSKSKTICWLYNSLGIALVFAWVALSFVLHRYWGLISICGAYWYLKTVSVCRPESRRRSPWSALLFWGLLQLWICLIISYVLLCWQFELHLFSWHQSWSVNTFAEMLFMMHHPLDIVFYSLALLLLWRNRERL